MTSPLRMALQMSGARSSAEIASGLCGRSFKRGALIARVELKQIGKRGKSRAGVEIFDAETGLFDQLPDNFFGQLGIVLKPDRVAHAPLADSLLDRRQ